MPISSFRIVASSVAAIALTFAAASVAAEPFIPKSDQDILDRAPTRLGASAAREARNAQAVLKANPRNLDLALRIAQHTFAAHALNPIRAIWDKIGRAHV